MAQPRLKMRLGDLLVAESIISDDQLQMALQQQIALRVLRQQFQLMEQKSFLWDFRWNCLQEQKLKFVQEVDYHLKAL